MAFDEEQKKCGGITIGGLFTLIVSVCMIALGAHYFQSGDVGEAKEPCMQCIPVALMAGGVLLILAMVFRFVIQRCCRKVGEIGADDKLCSSLNFACKFSVTLIYDAIVMICYIIWLIIFTVWTMEIHGSIKFIDGDSSTAVISDNLGTVGTDSSMTYECNVYLYDTSFWLVIVLWVVFLCTVTCGLLAKFCACFYNILCCKPCKGAEDRQQVATTA